MIRQLMSWGSAALALWLSGALTRAQTATLSVLANGRAALTLDFLYATKRALHCEVADRPARVEITPISVARQYVQISVQRDSVNGLQAAAASNAMLTNVQQSASLAARLARNVQD